MQKTKLSLTVFLLLGAIKLDAMVGGGFGGGGFGRGGGKVGLLYSAGSKAIPHGGGGRLVRDEDIATPLLAAVKKNNLEMVQLLLRHGADAGALGGRAIQEAISIKDPWQHRRSKKDSDFNLNLDLVNELIKAYAKQGHKQLQSLYWLAKMAVSGDPQPYDIEINWDDGREAPWVKDDKLALAIMERLIEAGFDVNKKVIEEPFVGDSYEYTPKLLIEATKRNNKPMVKLLLKGGAKRGLKNYEEKIARDYTQDEELKKLLTPPSTLVEDAKKKLGF